MPLRNKYIKYTSDITYEVFEKLWNLLYDKGWESYDCKNCKEQYKEFSGSYPILQDKNGNGTLFIATAVGKIISNNSECKITDLISDKLRSSDLKEGEYYIYYLDGKEGIIFKFHGINVTSKHLRLDRKCFKNDCWEYNCGKLEKASADQIAHFKKCRAIDKYVDADGIDNKFYYLKKGDKVKLLISSSYRGVIYNEGEVWEVIEDCEHEHNHIYVTRNGQKTTLYSFEYKKVNDKEPNVKPILLEPGILGGITHKLLPVPEVNEIPDISNYFPIIKELIFN